MIDGRFFTVPKVAERWDIAERSVWRMIAAGELKVSRFGERMTRIAESEVRRVENNAAAKTMAA
jgi:hypothetical protein